jgi:ParB/RepB/Spo0J family partition protein
MAIQKVYTISLDKLTLHPLAEITPQMNIRQFESLKKDIKDNGQLDPVLLYKHKIVDGRHRYKVMQELGENSIKAINLSESYTEADLKNIVLSKENRRHQTPTQKAIMAAREYNRLLAKGEEGITQGSVAELFAVSRALISRALKVIKLVPEEVADLLFNGEKIVITKENKEFATDNLLQLIKHYETEAEETVNKSLNRQELDITDEEAAFINDMFDSIVLSFSKRELKVLLSKLYNYIK